MKGDKTIALAWAGVAALAIWCMILAIVPRMLHWW